MLQVGKYLTRKRLHDKSYNLIHKPRHGQRNNIIPMCVCGHAAAIICFVSGYPTAAGTATQHQQRGPLH